MSSGGQDDKKKKKSEKKGPGPDKGQRKTVEVLDEQGQDLSDTIVMMLSDSNMAEFLASINNTASKTGKPQVLHTSKSDIDFIIIPCKNFHS